VKALAKELRQKALMGGGQIPWGETYGKHARGLEVDIG